VTDENCLPRNLSNVIAKSYVKRTYNSLSFVEFDVIIDNPEQGEIRLEMDADKTSNLKYQRYVYDLIVEYDGIPERVIEGIVTVYPSVTS
jgi:hypothetical protein